MPLNNTPSLSPACPSSNVLLNISPPVTTDFLTSGLIPTISTSSPTFTLPLSTLPVPTVPLPFILNTSSMDIKNGLSISLTGFGMYVSTASINFNIGPQFAHAAPPQPHSLAFSAEPLTTGISSPGKLYLLNNSRTSISTSSSNSGSSSMSTLFMNTTIFG